MNAAAPDSPPGTSTSPRREAIATLLLLVTIPAIAGCQVFHSTRADLEKARQQIGDGHVAWYGLESPLGPLGIHHLDPNYDAPAGSRIYGNRCSDRTR